MVDSSTSALSNLVASRLFTNLLTITIDSLSLKLSKTTSRDRSLFASIVKALFDRRFFVNWLTIGV